jgi:class 3 adenylate cyclase/ribosomal protein L40E
MKCLKCQTNNPEDRKYCRECGVKIIKVCVQCGSENLPQDKFCGECGYDFSLQSAQTPVKLSTDEKLEKLKQFIMKDLSEKILTQIDKIEGERKQVTVMFCDMDEFSVLSERLGLKATYSIMDQVYEILIQNVHEYDGTVNKMTGDGIMALFGAPIALEDAPQRAIRSAHAIHREITQFNDKIEREHGDGVPVKMRIGIHTGPAVVGMLGNDLRIEFKAVGDTVNLAP